MILETTTGHKYRIWFKHYAAEKVGIKFSASYCNKPTYLKEQTTCWLEQLPVEGEPLPIGHGFAIRNPKDRPDRVFARYLAFIRAMGSIGSDMECAALINAYANTGIRMPSINALKDYALYAAYKKKLNKKENIKE